VTAPRLGTPEVVIGAVGDTGTSHASRWLTNVIGQHKDVQLVRAFVRSCHCDRYHSADIGCISSFRRQFWHLGDLSYADGNQHVWDAYGDMLQSTGTFAASDAILCSSMLS
jgi:hypothetical protein